MARNMLWFVQKTYNFHYMRANFMDLKPKYEIHNKDARSNPIAFPFVEANLMIEL